MDSVLVCLAAITKYYNPVVEKKKKKLKLIFSHSSGGWEVQVQNAITLVLGESSFPGLHTTAFLQSSHMVLHAERTERERETHFTSSYKVLLSSCLTGP